MKPWLKILIITCGSIIILWIVGRVTKIFNLNHAAASANTPTIKKGDQFFSSILVEPKRYDFICFNIIRPEYEGRQLNFFRLCGLPGDVVEIKDGDLFVNNQPIDEQLNLQHNYYISANDFAQIKDSVQVDEEWLTEQNRDTLIVPLDDGFVTRKNIHAKRLILPKNYSEESITLAFSSDWNQDHFGPITVPGSKYFVLGDSRHNASDSRFVGFIDKKDFVGTVLWKH